MKREELQELLKEKDHYKREILRINSQLENAIIDFDGSLLAGIEVGLVKPAFAVSESFKRCLKGVVIA